VIRFDFKNERICDMRNCILASIFALAIWSIRPTTTCAGVIVNVSLDTSALAGSPGQGPFAVDFQLNDGSTGDGVNNNTATITSFNLSGGSLIAGTDSSSGGVSGVLGDNTNPLALNDNGFFNDFNQQFAAGTKLGLTVDLTANVSTSEGNGTGFPDEFAFAVYSNNFGSLASLLTIDITGPGLSVTTSGGSLGDGTSVPAPSLGAVPVPSTLMVSVLALSSLGLGVTCRRRMAAVRWTH
jgi:hypothetical protein